MAVRYNSDTTRYNNLLPYAKFEEIVGGGGCFDGSGKIQLAHTYEDIICVENLLAAWKEFLSGKRQRRDVQEFSTDFASNILALHHDLVYKTYRHGGYHEFRISDPKPRVIHKASVRDRLLHHAIYRILYPFFDQTFIADSFSCRKGKGTHKALERFRVMTNQISWNNTRTCWILKCDIKKFFASIDQVILLKILEQYIPDKDIMWLLKNIITSFESVSGLSHLRRQVPILGNEYRGWIPASAGTTQLRFCTGSPIGSGMTPRGLPLGNLTSQLLVNIYMNEFDQFVKHTLKAQNYIRYADDFVFISEDRALLQELLPKAGKFLHGRLSLTMHPDKIFLKTLASGIDFLGWVHFPDHRVLRSATKRRMMRRIEENTSDESFQSYYGLLSHGNAKKIQNELRMKQWTSSF